MDMNVCLVRQAKNHAQYHTYQKIIVMYFSIIYILYQLTLTIMN